MMPGFGFRLHSDADLTARVAQGSEKAFAEVMRRHQDAVYSFSLRMLGHPQDAEDAAQETFFRFFRAAGRFRSEASLRTYLLKVVRNICIDVFRKKQPDLVDELPELPDFKTPLDLLEGAMAEERLEKAVAGLPVNQRTALLLRHTERLSYREICQVMDLSQKAVESLLVRARKSLCEAVAQES